MYVLLSIVKFYVFTWSTSKMKALWVNIELLLFIRTVRPQLALPFPPAQSYGFRAFSPTKIIDSAVIILKRRLGPGLTWHLLHKWQVRNLYRREWGALCEVVWGSIAITLEVNMLCISEFHNSLGMLLFCIRERWICLIWEVFLETRYPVVFERIRIFLNHWGHHIPAIGIKSFSVIQILMIFWKILETCLLGFAYAHFCNFKTI